MRDALEALTGGRRVEIGVEHAAAAELQPEAPAFAHLQRWLAEALDELAGGEAEQVAAHLLLRWRRLLRLRTGNGRALRCGRATGGEQGCEGDQAAHARSISTKVAG